MSVMFNVVGIGLETRPPNWQQLAEVVAKKLDSIGLSTVLKTIEMSSNRTLLELTALNKYDDMFPALKHTGQSLLSTQMLLSINGICTQRDAGLADVESQHLIAGNIEGNRRLPMRAMDPEMAQMSCSTNKLFKMEFGSLGYQNVEFVC
ncbi:Hypothetical_protein [Hexamita inflata]|uniref:Hypothetical_protein n=1 Tax=Hexamita inflata TaxID=28002 RepID=A0AA86N4V7_9EUKA|nr:Hypothetical protein HINF_LOCUS553 [Hexamita inflata]